VVGIKGMLARTLQCRETCIAFEWHHMPKK